MKRVKTGKGIKTDGFPRTVARLFRPSNFKRVLYTSALRENCPYRSFGTRTLPETRVVVVVMVDGETATRTLQFECPVELCSEHQVLQTTCKNFRNPVFKYICWKTKLIFPVHSHKMDFTYTYINFSYIYIVCYYCHVSGVFSLNL